MATLKNLGDPGLPWMGTGESSMSNSFIIHPNRVPSHHPYLLFISPTQENILGMAILLGKTLQTSVEEFHLQVQEVKATLRGQAHWEPINLSLWSLGFGKISQQFRGS